MPVAGGPNQTMRLADPVMGASFARYDLDVARRLTLAPGDETLDLGPRDAPYYLFASLAILDPETAIRTISRLPHSTKRETESKMTAWLQFLEFFDTTTEARWNRLGDES